MANYSSENMQEASNNKSNSGLSIITAAELQTANIPSPRFIVDGLLPAGLSILAAPPKRGKSWFALALCLAVAQGKEFLGFPTAKCETLYLALEDADWRLKQRILEYQSGAPAPVGSYMTTRALGLDNGLLDQLENSVAQHPKIGLVVVDTFQRIRGAVRSRESYYAADYREIGILKAFADRHYIAVLLIHHLRKTQDETNIFNMISGTNGIMGAADTAMILTQENGTSILSAVGRDFGSQDIALEFDTNNGHWNCKGDVKQFAERQAKEKFDSTPLVQTITTLLKNSPNSQWTGTMQELLDAGKELLHKQIAPNPRCLSSKLKGMESQLLKNSGIIHTQGKHGSGGAKHTFHFEDVER